MKTTFIKITGLALSGLSLALCSGCVTFDGQEAAAQERENMLIMEEKMQRISGRIESIELQTERIQMDLDALKASQGRSSQVQTLQSALDDANRRISALEASRERDKQEIVDRLGKRITDIMKTSASSRPSSAPASSKRSSSGYEHVVKTGETLSAIASAYGVKPSVIMEANGLKDSNMLRVGQKLFIPD